MAFIIATLIYFVLSLGLALVSLVINVGRPDGSNGSIAASAINILISLGFITWSIILLAS